MKKLYTYIFCKPNIKVGDKLNWHGKTCTHIYFDWKDGIWFIDTGSVAISWGLEKYYKEHNIN